MKKIYCLIYIFVFSLCLCSCLNNAKQNDFNGQNHIGEINKEIANLPDEAQEINIEGSSNFNYESIVKFEPPLNDNSVGKGEYEFSEKVYNLIDSANNIYVDIKYPQIENLADKDLENSINEMILTRALENFNFFKEAIFSGEFWVEIETSYAITRNSKDIVSIDFTLMFFQQYQAHPNIRKNSFDY